MSERLSRMPLRAPVWLWVLYALTIAVLGVLTGSAQGFVMCYFAAAFSFQFWTYACWRGATAAKDTP